MDEPRMDAGAALRGLLLVMMAAACSSSSAARYADTSGTHSEESLGQDPPIVLTGNGDKIIPEFECMQRGCPDTVQCGAARCFVTHCGKGSCTNCGGLIPVPDSFKNLVIKEWCAYGCMSASKSIGSAYGFVPAVGGKTFVGPICPAQPAAFASARSGEGEGR
ncbi:hypothetical protein JRI60_10515 [Archangium violaceum]|uniref:hypothetical protein n=1 Tax=Archangium violaceum TaxID=83451 RepID=UPI00194EC6E9|nr:hypothetical protein [Archangium violaceum]QRN99415.1 hypothetical protein JRI60_10515 [Archangium violaceum]